MDEKPHHNLAVAQAAACSSHTFSLPLVAASYEQWVHSLDQPITRADSLPLSLLQELSSEVLSGGFVINASRQLLRMQLTHQQPLVFTN